MNTFLMSRRALVLSFATLFVTFGGSLAQAADLQDSIDDAVGIIHRFKDLPEDETIPADIIRHAKGLVIMSVVKVGFIIAGHGGEGVLIARLPNGSWSGPVGVATGGLGVGFQAGGQNTEFVIVLNTDDAVRAFAKGSNVKLGGELSVAAGPIGRNLNGSVLPNAAVYSYSRSEGLFAGVSLDGAVIAMEKQTNADYYGGHYSVRRILSGEIPAPTGAAKLISELSYYKAE